MTYRPTWEIVQEAAECHTAQGGGTFRLCEIIAYVQSIDLARERSSIGYRFENHRGAQPHLRDLAPNALHRGTGSYLLQAALERSLRLTGR